MRTALICLLVVMFVVLVLDTSVTAAKNKPRYRTYGSVTTTTMATTTKKSYYKPKTTKATTQTSTKPYQYSTAGAVTTTKKTYKPMTSY